MYVRTTQRRNRDGSVVRYVQLAHNYRDKGATKAGVLVNLGREDRLDPGCLRRLAESIGRYLGDASPVDPAPAALASSPGGPQVLASKSLGAVWLLDGLWSRLGVAGALEAAVGRRRFTIDIDVERVLFALVANRAIDPCSELPVAEWIREDAAVPGLAGMDDVQAQRAMNLLVDADVEGAVQKAVFSAAADILQLDGELLLFGTTSARWECDTHAGGPGPGGEAGGAETPQVVIGMAVTGEGIPVRTWVWPDHGDDHSLLAQVEDELRGLGRIVSVVDRGPSGGDDLDHLTRVLPHVGGHRLANPVKAHVLLCWLAQLLIRLAERSTGRSWRRIATDLGRLHQISLALDAGTAVCTSKVSDAQKDIFHACGITPPPRMGGGGLIRRAAGAQPVHFGD